MTTLDLTTGSVHRRSARLLRRAALNTATNFYRAWKNRRAFYRLGEMSDAELADIGLTRADLHVAIDVPFGGDPTVRLGHIAEARAAQDPARRQSRAVERAARRLLARPGAPDRGLPHLPVPPAKPARCPVPTRHRSHLTARRLQDPGFFLAYRCRSMPLG